MLPEHHWACNFTVSSDDLEHITTLLLEQETPLSSSELALSVIEQRLHIEKSKLQEHYQDTLLYTPAKPYKVGQRLAFPAIDFATGAVVAIRDGMSESYGDFQVIAIEFDDAQYNLPDKKREFAASLTVLHVLNRDDSEILLPGESTLTAQEILDAAGVSIIDAISADLLTGEELVAVAEKWFPRDLILEVDIGHLHLAEAVLDMHTGGPLSTHQVLQDIGGLGDSPESLQIFSLNHAMNQDDRFDEVGSAGEIRWFLRRLEPQEVQSIPENLQYRPIDYDRSILTPDLIELENDLQDEHSPGEGSQGNEKATFTLIYPHRRNGTMPLNAHIRQIFPTAKTPHIFITFIDAQDGEQFPGWVVQEHNYIYGLASFYQKHHLPVGAYVSVQAGDLPGQIIVDFNAYRPRTEWIQLVQVNNQRLSFESSRRAIGADYDDLIIIGVDDLEEIDQLQKHERNLASILKELLIELGKITPQGAVHAKTLYSTVNVIRRCAPGPIFATLIANPDFEDVGGHYWKLSS